MPFTKPTLQQIVDRMKTDLQGKIPEAGSWLRNSLMEIFITVVAGSHYLMHDFLEWAKNQLFATTAESEYLEIQGSEYGLFRSYGEKATGNVVVTGEIGSAIPAGTKIQSALGQVYLFDVLVNFSSTSAVCAITAESIGSEFNQLGGSTLSFVSPIAGIQTDCLVDSIGLSGGVDIESDDAYRNRIISRKKEPPHGGTEADYVSWAKEVTGVTRAWATPQVFGPGTIGVSFVRDGDTPIFPTPADIETVRQYIIGHTDSTGRVVGCPVTAAPGLIMSELEPLSIDFYIKTYPFNSVTVASIEEKLRDMMIDRGGPGEEITISQMYEAVTSSTGEIKSVITSPVANVTASYMQLPIVGNVFVEALL